METEFQTTLHFCDATDEERATIYENLGFRRINVLKGLNEKSAASKAAGIDVSAIDENGKNITISEKILDRRYASMLEKRVPVELYSDFENKAQGWLRTSSAMTVFYFFTDAVVSIELAPLREFIDQLYEESTVEDEITELVNTFIEHGVSGKHLDGKDGVGIYVFTKENGHHSVGLMLNPDELPDESMDVTEYYFEEEEGADEEEGGVES